jgi:hypothetical protein
VIDQVAMELFAKYLLGLAGKRKGLIQHFLAVRIIQIAKLLDIRSASLEIQSRLSNNGSGEI